MKRFLSALAAIICLAMPLSASAAYNPLSAACSNGGQAKQSVACNTNGSNPISGPNGVLKKVTIVIAFVAGVAAVIVIIVSGMRFVFSGGDAQKAASARSALIGALVGLVIIVSAESILIFVINKL
jgi:hypothetical protein